MRMIRGKRRTDEGRAENSGNPGARAQERRLRPCGFAVVDYFEAAAREEAARTLKSPATGGAG